MTLYHLWKGIIQLRTILPTLCHTAHILLTFQLFCQLADTLIQINLHWQIFHLVGMGIRNSDLLVTGPELFIARLPATHQRTAWGGLIKQRPTTCNACTHYHNPVQKRERQCLIFYWTSIVSGGSLTEYQGFSMQLQRCDEWPEGPALHTLLLCVSKKVSFIKVCVKLSELWSRYSRLLALHKYSPGYWHYTNIHQATDITQIFTRLLTLHKYSPGYWHYTNIHQATGITQIFTRLLALHIWLKD
jgi:hypothetical protein